ncbi:hypothetical protein PTE30175_04189 [Pandoraea terrae]|uniref:Uncharacterized protein n=1 Tax=Pandoraea terrae TaxID=1537710 RepID=A0A5E4Y4Z2_9BURK|nr:DUF6781 family protein [Pandoraea terrae]VVE43634.1 hypothetical protein PTE30175_04189 [Pandoraea terrae]
MFKYGIDQDALIDKFSEATAKQGEAIRKAVHDATLKALQSRELTLTNIRQVVNTVAKAASSGAAVNPLKGVDVESLLGQAVTGMDSALVQAVEANRRALGQMVEQGATLRESQAKKALADLDKLEGTLLAVVRKFTESAGEQLQASWTQVLKATQSKGTGTGVQASAAIQQLMDSAQKNLQSLKEGQALGLRASQVMFDSYSTLVSGVLIGMSEALQQTNTAVTPTATACQDR